MWLTEKQMQEIVERLQKNRTVRHKLPDGGHLFIDRQLPFISLFRNSGAPRDTGMDKMPAGEAAALSVSTERKYRAGATDLLTQIATMMSEHFGAFLILEIWAGEIPEQCPNRPPRSEFKVYTTPHGKLTETVECLKKRLGAIRSSKLIAGVESVETKRATRPGLPPCVPLHQMRSAGIEWLGVEIAPVYVNPETLEIYPLLYRAIRRQVDRAVAQAFFTFTRNHTTHHPRHFHTLGRRAVVKAVWEVDRLLAGIDNSFDLLRQVTPINAEAAWHTFQRNRFEKAPRFLYRPRPIDPGEMKQRLFNVPLERIEDPTLQRLFLDKQQELDRELSLLADLNREAFRYGSLQMHGAVGVDLMRQAEDLLAAPRKRKQGPKNQGVVDAGEFIGKVEIELTAYRREHPGFRGSARLCPEMYAGMLVSRGELIIGQSSSFSASRCDALIQHEVGTHILTWSNGLDQPLQLLATGLPRYEEFQEGLAVLAEYLSGGLDPQRLHVLAARVVAVKAMTSNADFIEVFRLLTREHRFTQRSAYLITMRVFRGGGFAKDAVYLRGLATVLQYISDGGSLEECFAGKMGAEHMPVYRELLLRRILKPPTAIPAYMKRADAQEKLNGLARGMTVGDLIKNRR